MTSLDPRAFSRAGALGVALPAAAEAVGAADAWNASAGYFRGFLPRGARVAFSRHARSEPTQAEPGRA